MKFENVTEKATSKVEKVGQMAYRLSILNQDGLLDIYVSQVGDFEILKGHNLLFVCQKIGADGVPVYEDNLRNMDLI
jgi:hypothetical protein